MIGAFDYIGLAAVITSLGTAAAAIIGAVLTSQVKGKVSTNGDPREIGQIMSDVAAKVAPAPAPVETGDGH